MNNDWKLDIDITLTDDINLTGIDWTPICPDNSKKYTGTFDGGNPTITGLTADMQACSAKSVPAAR